jgi:hypothetical protein
MMQVNTAAPTARKAKPGKCNNHKGCCQQLGVVDVYYAVQNLN